VEDLSSDSSPPVAVQLRLKIQPRFCSGSLKLGTAAGAAAQAMPSVQHRGIQSEPQLSPREAFRVGVSL